MASFPARIVTPERILLEEEVAAVMLRTAEGDATYLAGHTSLVGAVVPGLVRFEQEDGTVHRVAVHGGFVQVEGDGVVVLAPEAELAAEIDAARAQLALETAENRLAALGAAGVSEGERGDAELTEAQAAKRRAEVRLEVAGPA